MVCSLCFKACVSNERLGWKSNSDEDCVTGETIFDIQSCIEYQKLSQMEIWIFGGDGTPNVAVSSRCQIYLSMIRIRNNFQSSSSFGFPSVHLTGYIYLPKLFEHIIPSVFDFKSHFTERGLALNTSVTRFLVFLAVLRLFSIFYFIQYRLCSTNFSLFFSL